MQQFPTKQDTSQKANLQFLTVFLQACVCLARFTKWKKILFVLHSPEMFWSAKLDTIQKINFASPLNSMLTQGKWQLHFL